MIEETIQQVIESASGKVTFFEPEAGSDEYTLGPNTTGISLKTKELRDFTDFNKVDKEIAKYFLFGSDVKENDVYLRNPETNIVYKIEQTISGSLSPIWLKANLPHLVPNLIKLIKDNMLMGDECTFSNNPTGSQVLLNAKELERKLPEAAEYFPIVIRQHADRFGPTGRNYAFNDKEKGKITICEKAKLTLSKNGDVIDIFDALAENIFSLKCPLNTINPLTSIVSYSNYKEDYAYHKILEVKHTKSDEESFLTKWLKNRLTPGEIKILQAWVFAVYDSKNRGRQILWIYDPEGNSGKSTFFNAVFRDLMNNQLVYAVDKADTSFGGRFDASAYYDKRLMLVPDCKNRKVVKYGTIHQLTGGDQMKVEFKGARSFSFRPALKILIGSNEPPEIDLSARHEKTRIIVLNWKLNEKALHEIVYHDKNGNILRDKMGEPIFHGDSTLEDRLHDSLPEFLGECKAAYTELCNDRNTINPEAAMDNLYNIADDNGQFYDDFFDTYFEKSALEYVLIADIESRWVEHLRNDTNQALMKNKGVSPNVSDMISHFTKQGYIKKRKLINGKQRYVLMGMKASELSNVSGKADKGFDFKEGVDWK